jgi:predicted transcriptional regulator of viral defense system
MKPVEAYGALRRLGRPVITIREAAALWRTEQGTARRRLRALQEAGLVLGLRRGLWALAVHGLIEQIPRQISVVSLDRARRIETAIGSFAVHHLAPELFGGYVAWKGGGFVASAEKALFDLVYVRAAAGRRAHLPELSLPATFERDALRVWSERIRSPRLQTLVSKRLRELLREASE